MRNYLAPVPIQQCILNVDTDYKQWLQPLGVVASKQERPSTGESQLVMWSEKGPPPSTWLYLTSSYCAFAACSPYALISQTSACRKQCTLHMHMDPTCTEASCLPEVRFFLVVFCFVVESCEQVKKLLRVFGSAGHTGDGS